MEEGYNPQKAWGILVSCLKDWRFLEDDWGLDSVLVEGVYPN